MKKAFPWLAVVIVILLAIGGTLYAAGQLQKSTMQTTEETATSTIQTTSSVEQKPVLATSTINDVWTAEPQYRDPETAAMVSKVFLTVASGERFEVGTSQGDCFPIIGSGWELLEGERSGMVCYSGGGGDEYGVFNEYGKVVVKRGLVEEGNDEYAGGRMEFEVIRILEG